MADIRAVVFDLGGVMIRLAAGWEHACRAAGVAFRPFPVTAEYRAALDVLEHEYGCGRITPDDYFTRLDALVDGRYPPRELRALHQAVIQEEFPGLYELVDALKAAGIFTACLSNTCASHWVDLANPEKYPAIGLLDARCASHLFGLMKPDHAIYRRFEAYTGFSPAEILFFDDLAANVAAAQACGWHARQITGANAVPEIYLALETFGVDVLFRQMS